MRSNNRPINLLRTLILLTLFFIAFEVIIAFISAYVAGIMDIAKFALSTKLFFSSAVIPPVLQFISAQLIIHSFYLYLLWFVTITIAEFFNLRQLSEYSLGVFLWINSTLAIVALNFYLVPHSLFTTAIRSTLLDNALTDQQVFVLLMMTLAISISAGCVAFIIMCFNLLKKEHPVRNSLMVVVLFILTAFTISPGLSKLHKKVQPVNSQPNIFIIGFDALRPDFLTYFHGQGVKTPHFDAFLNSATVFNEAYTPIARTLPSWMSILTGRYPMHTGVRENSMYLGNVDLHETLAKRLTAAGYETLYATDDRRFNNIDERVGFEKVIGPKGTVADYLVGTINDFPLSNLIVPTPIGKILFPYNYANRGSSQTYDPNNFLSEIDSALNQAANKPVFLAVHFNLSGWPFFWFNDKSAYDADFLTNYKNTIAGDDKLLANFLAILEQHGLLQHAIVVLLSDHGITLALHGDRDIKEEKFRGNKAEMKVRRTLYLDAEDMKPEQWSNSRDSFQVRFGKRIAAVFNQKNYGIDTSYGYGGDILSLKQNHALLAIKSFGVDFGRPHVVSGRSTFFDIAPTLLDILRLPPLSQSDGISLKAYLYNASITLPNNRPLFFETAYSIGEVEQFEIFVSKVIAKSIAHFEINPRTGAVFFNPKLITLLIENKQRAILSGDWLLAYYPVSERFKFVNDTKEKAFKITPYTLPPYFVLVNLKTGEWTTAMNNPLLLKSPFAKLKQALFTFFGPEMEIYANKKS